jgi:putative endonuclease
MVFSRNYPLVVNSSEGEDWKARLKRLGIARRRRPKAAPKDRRRVEAGRGGEDAAARHLEENGLVLLGRNVRYRDGEIDLVALDGPTLVFVEVKWRRNDARGTPAEAVTSRKRLRVIRAARRWLVENPGVPERERFGSTSWRSGRSLRNSRGSAARSTAAERDPGRAFLCSGKLTRAASRPCLYGLSGRRP